MPATTQIIAVPSRSDSACDHGAGRQVVAVVLEWRGKIALLKRSHAVRSDPGLWHCITGFVEPGISPTQQALEELREETGLEAADLGEVMPGPVLTLGDEEGKPWTVHTFTAVTNRRRLDINWEHTAFRWTSPSRIRRYSNRVSWLDGVLDATGGLRRTSKDLPW